jgi:hypothetical protein
MAICRHAVELYGPYTDSQRVAFWALVAVFAAGVVILVVQWPNPSPGLLLVNGAILTFAFLNILVRSRRGSK